MLLARRPIGLAGRGEKINYSNGLKHWGPTHMNGKPAVQSPGVCRGNFQYLIKKDGYKKTTVPGRAESLVDPVQDRFIFTRL
jgi:hypothetical protein